MGHNIDAVKTGKTKGESVSKPRATKHKSSNTNSSLNLNNVAGNLAVQRALGGGIIQPKLTISQPGDPYEKEADRVADQVMRMPTGGSAPAALNSQVSSRIGATKGGGQPLPSSTRAFFESRFGHDFSGVRLHSDREAANLASNIHARAFTIGRDITFGAGMYAPASTVGRRLLAHELSHVIQQSTGSVSEVVQRKPDKGTYIVEVVDSNGKPIKGAMVFLQEVGTSAATGLRTNAAGIATFEVEEGNYQLTIDPPGRCFKVWHGQPFTLSGNMSDGTTIRLRNLCDEVA